MQLKNHALTVTLVACVLIACNKKPTDNATPQTPQGGSPSQSAQSAPASAAPMAAADPAAPAAIPNEAVLASPPPEPIVIPSGAVLTVRLQQGLSSKTSSQGDPFNATLAQPLTVKGEIVAPAGSSLSGIVTEAHKAGRFKGGATLDIALNSLTINDKIYRLTTMTMAQTSKGKGKRTAVMTGGGAGGGALIGGLAGGGKGAAVGALVGAGAGVVGSAFTGNRDIEMPAESAVSFQLTKSLKLPPRKTSAEEPQR
jgi:hypothetical protein